MEIIKTEKRLCTCCMEEHGVKTVLVKEQVEFKGLDVAFDAIYFLCDKADVFYADEIQMYENDINMKAAYREKSAC